MEPSKSRTAATIAVSIFALIILSFFILRTSLNLMNQRSDLRLLLGITGIAIILFLWGLLATKLFKVMGCKGCKTIDVKPINKQED